MDVPGSLRDIVGESLDQLNLSPAHVQMFLVKETSSKNEARKFKLGTVDIRDEVAEDFRSTITKKLTEVSSRFQNHPKDFKDFYSIGTQRHDLSQLKSSDIGGFAGIKQKVKEHTEVIKVKKFEDIKHFEAYAVEFKLKSGTIIYFRKIPSSRIITKKFSLALLLSSGVFNKVKEDILAADKDVDCIYFEKTDSLLVLDKLYTEQIFNFKKDYQMHTEAIFKHLADSQLVIINQELLKKILNNTPMVRRVTNLIKNAKFNRTIDFFDNHAAYFKQNEKIFKKELTQLVIRDSKVIIDNEDELKTFLAICNDAYVKGAISGMPYFADAKEDMIEKKQKVPANT